MNQLHYRLSHPPAGAVAALQSTLGRDGDKYSRIRFDHASFDAQVFGKPALMGGGGVGGGGGPTEQEAPSHLPDCESGANVVDLHGEPGWRMLGQRMLGW